MRDSSSWECTLKPRLHERLRSAKNIILFLSSHTTTSRALAEEINYGVNTLELPVIVVYPELDPIDRYGDIETEAYCLWGHLPVFKNSMDKVPTLHIPMEKSYLRRALNDADFMI